MSLIGARPRVQVQDREDPAVWHAVEFNQRAVEVGPGDILGDVPDFVCRLCPAFKVSALPLESADVTRDGVVIGAIMIESGGHPRMVRQGLSTEPC